MTRRSGWPAVVAVVALETLCGVAKAQTLPPEPILRIEAGMHSAAIRRIGVDAGCRMVVTGSFDKTARLWAIPEGRVGDAKLQRVLRVPIGRDDEGRVVGVAISSDGRFVAAGGYDVGWRQFTDIAVYVFEATTGRLVRRLGGLNNSIQSLSFSPDGRFLAASLGGGTRIGGMRVWETTGWSLVGQDSGYDDGGSYGVAFDAGNGLYSVAYDGFLRRYGPPGFTLEAKVKTLGGERPYSVAVNPRGDQVAVVFDDSAAVEVYGAQDLRRLFAADTTKVHNENFYGITWSADGARLYAGGRNATRGSEQVRIWDQEGRGKGQDVALTRDTIMQLLPCRDAIAVGAQDPAFGLISGAAEKQVWQEGAVSDMREKRGENFTVSDDGSKVLFGLGVGGNRPVLFDLTAGRLTEQPLAASGLAPPNTESLNVTDWLNDTAPKLDGRPLEFARYETSHSVAIAPDGNHFVLGAEWSLRAYGKDGKQLWRSEIPDIAWGVNIPRGGKFVVAAYGDGTIRWHRLSDGEEILALFVNAKTREWVLWTPQGYYTASVNGDQNVGWHVNKGWEQAAVFVTAARLKKHLFRPDIVKRAFELADAEAAVREAGLSGFKLAVLANHAPPDFRIVDPGDKTHADKSPIAVKLELSETNDPVDGFDVNVNGRQVTPRDVREIDQPTKDAETLNLNIPLEKGENHIQIAAHNSVGETLQDLLVYLDREGVLNKKGRLFIVAVGVDKYHHLPPTCGAFRNQSCDLHYAGADARLMIDTLTKKAGPLHTEVISKLLVSGGDTPPTKPNIENALLAFRDARAEDTVILFLASHGFNEGADYLMIPEEAERTAKGYWLPSSVVKWSVLQDALQEAQGSRIMFVDTCHSSGAYSSRLVKDAADANIVVFSATDRDTEAQETSNLGHGVFTYALSEGLNGKADLGRRGSVNILALGDYVAEEVKRMTNNEQEPVFSGSGVKNFVVATP